MKIVLDTNVIVSGMLMPGGTCRRILDLMLDGTLTACTDARMLNEYADVLNRPEFSLSDEGIELVLGVIRTSGNLVSPMPLAAKLPDPRDLAFLEAAASAKAILVTGNARHFPPKERGEVTVLSPAELLATLRGGC